MTDKMVDVGGRRRPVRPTSAANIFWSSFPTFTPTSAANVGLSVGECWRVSASVVRGHCRSSFPTLRPTSAADVSVSVGQLGRRRWLT